MTASETVRTALTNQIYALFNTDNEDCFELIQACIDDDVLHTSDIEILTVELLQEISEDESPDQDLIDKIIDFCETHRIDIEVETKDAIVFSKANKIVKEVSKRINGNVSDETTARQIINNIKTILSLFEDHLNETR